VSHVTENASGEFIIQTTGTEDIREELAKTVVQNGWGLLEMRPLTHALEDVFLRVISPEVE